MMAEKWNDPLFLPAMAVLSDLHSDFSWPLPVLFDSVRHMQPATAEKVDER